MSLALALPEPKVALDGEPSAMVKRQACEKTGERFSSYTKLAAQGGQGERVLFGLSAASGVVVAREFHAAAPLEKCANAGGEIVIRLSRLVGLGGPIGRGALVGLGRPFFL